MLETIRKKLSSAGLEAYIISYGNRFIGQDVLPQEHKLSAVCGFTGSAGAAVITQNKAFLLVDGRYELQASLQVNTEQFTIVPAIPSLLSVCSLLKDENITKIGCDFWNYSIAEINFIKKRFKDIELEDAGNWIAEAEHQDVCIFSRDIKYCGMTREDKCKLVAHFLQEQQADYFLFTSSDSVSWLLNIYAKDLPYSPVVRAYALVDIDGNFRLFGNRLKAEFTTESFDDLKQFFENCGSKKILYVANSTPEKIKHFINEETKFYARDDMCQILKAEKNQTELNGMIKAHIRDGVALVKLLNWLEKNPQQTELSVVAKLHDLRAEQKDFFSESFATIAGFADNGAIVHYQPTEQTNKSLQNGNILLLDSGGQYFDGTTDITRTISIGNPDAKIIRDFTYVLKAHIALASARFPLNTGGTKLDAIARAPLWQHCMDYKHGTGHGVSCFGNVHEGPISISIAGSNYPFKENMVTSIEPGIYVNNQYGIRIENLYYTSKVEDNPDYLEFRCLTVVPIDKRLIDKYLLSGGEQQWLNNYHKYVYDCLSAYVNEDERKWLEKACSPL
ncbi:MAG: aminopeptidase P family protein [Alphaproteobacteria bacterium]|nr:aminopeptidase P family protein [Alphaproteobacteria bacterium]